MAITAETRTAIIQLVVTAYDAAPGTTLLTELVALVDGGGSLSDVAANLTTRTEWTSKYPSFQTSGEFGAEWLGALVPEASAESLAAGVVVVEGLVAGGSTFGEIIIAAQGFLAALPVTDAAFGTSAANFSNKVTVATYQTITLEEAGAGSLAGVTSDAATVTAANTAAAAVINNAAGTTLALTVGLDSGAAFAGGANNDTFTAQETSTALTDTLTTGDNLVGGAGTDTLSIAVSGTPAGGITSGVVTSGIEAVKVYNNSTAAYEVDAALMTGLADVYVSGGTQPVTIDDVDALANLHLLSTNVNATLSTTAAAVAGAADAGIILSNGSAQSAAVTATYDGLEVINFSAAGVTGVKTALVDTSLTLASTDLEKVVVTGASNANLTVNLAGAALETQTSEFDASAAGGIITAHVTKGASATATVTMSAQGDYLDYNGALANTATLDGGTGTDTLELDTDIAYSAATATAGLTQAGAGISNFEVLRLASGTDVDERAIANNAGITNVIAVGAGSYTKSTALASVTQLSSGTFTTTAATDGAADVLTVNLLGAGVASTLSAANVETLTVASGGAAANSVTMSAAQSADLTSITASGTQGLTLTIANTKLATVDASAVTGVGSAFVLAAGTSTAAMTVTASANRPTVSATGTANTITTGSGADTITGGAYKDVISAGNGANTVSGGNGNNTVTTGRNADTITVGDGNNNITAGIGNDTVTVGGTATSSNTIDLGSGNDTVTSGAGVDTITLGAGNDTVTSGAGKDKIYMSDFDDADVIDSGTGTDTLSASALVASSAASPTLIQAAAQFVTLSPGTSKTSSPQFTGVENVYMEVSLAAANSATITTQETVDFTSTSGITNLYLEITDLGAGGADDPVLTLSDVDATAIHLVDRKTIGAADDLAKLVVDGTSQALTIKGYGFVGTTVAAALTVTDVSSLTLTSYQDTATVAVANTNFGIVLADDTDSVTVNIPSNTAALGGATTTIASLSADNATSIALTAGTNQTLAVTAAAASTSDALDTLTLTAGNDGTLTAADVDSTNGALSTVTLDLGINSTMTVTNELDVATATTGTITVGAASTLTMSDLIIGGSATTLTGTASSVVAISTYGKTGQTASTITMTGRGDLTPTFAIDGDTTVSTKGWTDTNATAWTVTTTGNDDLGFISNDLASTVTTGNGANTVTTGTGIDTITGGTGIDTISSGGGVDTIHAGPGADVINAGAGNDIINPDNSGNKRVETVTIIYATGSAADVITVGGVAVTFITGVNLAAAKASMIAAINGTTALDNIAVASANVGAAIVDITYLVDGNIASVDTTSISNTNTVAQVTAGTVGVKGIDVMTGGTGTDFFVLAVGESGAAPSATVFDTITDFGTASDTIDLVSAALTIVGNSTASSGTAAISSAGIATFNAADSTLALQVVATEAGINAGGTAAAGQVAVFQSGTDAYVFLSDGVDGVGANDSMIKLTGVDTTATGFDTVTLASGNMTLA